MPDTPLSGRGSAPSVGGGPSVTPEDVWKALRRAGFTATEAIGAMANALNESSLNPETNVVDSNGARSYGIWQFNAASYPGASRLVSGNPQADLEQQVSFLAANGGKAAASGSTGAEAASNFAAKFERCQGCQPGGSQNLSRTANARVVEGWVASGKWPDTGGSAADQASVGGNPSADCAWQIGWGGVFGIGGFQACIVSKSELRAIIGTGLWVGGSILLLAGVAVLASMIGIQTLAGPAATALNVLPTGKAAKAVAGGATKASVAAAA